MSEDTATTPSQELLEAVWAEARDLVRKLEGSTVQRLAVAAGDCKIEIERGAPAPVMGPSDAAEAPLPPGPLAAGAGPGLGVAPGARAASGVFTLGDAPSDTRIPVLAPLVGAFYQSTQPGEKPFVTVGDVVEAGQTVCIVEAMKLMNEVATPEGGRVAEIAVENGEPVEFEQVLMYLEPVED
ncbi:MAG TPA: biotin/lipoyl-containing protein [Thermoleophilaceae bacterium]|nr:biotin/lipoyl-containing protein [Thermoleophilaceae bacterium]